MTVTLVFLALLMAVFVGWLLSQTVNVQPWAATRAPERPPMGIGDFPTAVVGLVVFVAVVTSIFALFSSALLMRQNLGDWQPLAEPQWLWLNTGILLLGSVALQFGWLAASRGNLDNLRSALLVAGVCIVLFVVGQGFAWWQLDAAGYYAASNPANAFFYVITGLHAMHIVGGLIAWGRTTNRSWSASDARSLLVSVQLSALYFHFLFLVWIAMFLLLLQH